MRCATSAAASRTTRTTTARSDSASGSSRPTTKHPTNKPTPAERRPSVGGDGGVVDQGAEGGHVLVEDRAPLRRDREPGATAATDTVLVGLRVAGIGECGHLLRQVGVAD